MPDEEEFDVNATRLVGLNFNADEQCKAQFGPTAAFCPSRHASKVSYYLAMYVNDLCNYPWE